MLIVPPLLPSMYYSHTSTLLVKQRAMAASLRVCQVVHYSLPLYPSLQPLQKNEVGKGKESKVEV